MMDIASLLKQFNALGGSPAGDANGLAGASMGGAPQAFGPMSGIGLMQGIMGGQQNPDAGIPSPMGGMGGGDSGGMPGSDPTFMQKLGKSYKELPQDQQFGSLFNKAEQGRGGGAPPPGGMPPPQAQGQGGNPAALEALAPQSPFSAVGQQGMPGTQGGAGPQRTRFQR